MNARTLLLTFGLACIAAATPSVDSLAPDATDEMREALESAPPEAIYNAGVQMFRAGNFEAARNLFSTAASRGKESVAARSMYNLGTSGYADALKLLQPAEGGGAGSPPTDTSSDGAPVHPRPVNPRDQAISALEDAGPAFALINAAAYIDVERAESERDLAFAVNADAAGWAVLADDVV